MEVRVHESLLWIVLAQFAQNDATTYVAKMTALLGFVGMVGKDYPVNNVLAILGAVAAGLSAWAATQSATAAKAANQASDQMAAIEAARRHQELTPELDVRIEPWGSGNLTTYRLFVGLAGPIALRQVEALTIRIRDDRPGRATESVSYSGQMATREQIAAQIWGPLRFTPLVQCGGGTADADGRSIVMPEGLQVGESRQLQLEVVQPPPWTGSDGARAAEWWLLTVGAGVRLAIELVNNSDESWLIPIEVHVPELLSAGSDT